jgi:hypothetical protein
VAQFGSALDWGSSGRRFKSCQPDHSIQASWSTAAPNHRHDKTADATLLLLAALAHRGKLPNLRKIFQGSSKTSAATFAMTGQTDRQKRRTPIGVRPCG